MFRWPELLAQLESQDPSLQKKLKLLCQHESQTPLSILKQDRFIGANQATFDYFQCQYVSYIGATPYDFSPRIQANGLSSIDESKRLIEQALSGKGERFHWLHLSSDDTELPTQIQLTPYTLNDSPVLLVEYLPLDRRKAPRRLEEDGFDALPKQVMSNTLEESAEAVYICDQDDRIIAVNRAMCRITGYSPEQLKGKSPQILSTSQDLYNQDDRLATISQRGFWQGEVHKKRADGSQFPAWVSCRRITTDNNQKYNVTLFSDISAKKHLEAKLTKQAMFDSLTGLPNRFHLTQLLNDALKEVSRTPNKLGALMFLDLNGFKNVNDSFGHSMGDRLLQLVSARLETCCTEKSDIARMGGDEFTLILSDCDSKEEIHQFAQRVLALFDAPFEIERQKFYIGTSIGITLFPTDGQQPNQLLSQADTAMYSAKKSSSHICFYDIEMSKAAEKRLNLINELRNAMALEEFTLAYQALIDLETNKVRGVEALLRWQKTPDTLLKASQFVPLLEETGLIITVGQWVLQQACNQAAKWRKQYDSELQISVNISPMQFEHLDFVHQVTKALEIAQLPAQALILEITEPALLRKPQTIRKTMDALKALGVNIALDNFGTGLFSLSRLGSLPIDSLKIDTAFVRNLDPNSSQQLCQAIIGLAQALNIKFVAEGIETDNQKQLISSMGKGLAQGYLFGHPSSAESFCSRYLA